MKNRVIIILEVIMITILVLFVVGSASATTTTKDKTYTFHFAHTQGLTSNPYHNYVEKFKQVVEKRSEGRIIIIEHPVSELGGEREYIESCQMGTLDFAIANVGAFTTFTHCLDWATLYYVLTSAEQVERAIQDPLVIDRLNEITKIGLNPLSFTSSGPRGVFTRKKPVNSPTDLKRLTIRTMESPIHVAAWGALGANPTPLAYSELYSALQYGTVDGAENPITGYKSVKFYEPAPYFAFTNHQWSIGVAFASKKVWDKLDLEDQKILREAAKEASVYQLQTRASDEKKSIEELKKLGVTFTYPNIKEFAAVVVPAVGKWETSVGKDFLEHIRGL